VVPALTEPALPALTEPALPALTGFWLLAELIIGAAPAEPELGVVPPAGLLTGAELAGAELAGAALAGAGLAEAEVEAEPVSVEAGLTGSEAGAHSAPGAGGGGSSYP
jgi:hypothetical protein